MQTRHVALFLVLTAGCTKQQSDESSPAKLSEKKASGTTWNAPPQPAKVQSPTTVEAAAAVTSEKLPELVQKAAQHEAREEYEQALQYRKRILSVVEKQFGGRSWQATNARLSLENTERKIRLGPHQHQVLAEIGRLERDAVESTRSGQLPAAADAYSRILELAPQVFPDRSIPIANYAFRKGQIHLAARQYDLAEQPYKTARSIQEELLGRHHPDTANTLNAIGVLYLRTGRHEEAQSALLQAADLTEKVWGPDSEHHAGPLNNLGTLWIQMQRFADAEHILQRALEIRRKQYGEEHFFYADTMYNLGMVQLATKDYGQAVTSLERAAKIHQETFGTEHEKTLQSIGSLAAAYRLTKQYGKAEPLLKRVLDYNRSRLGSSHELTISNKYHLGLVLGYQAKYEEAEPLLAGALRDLERLHGADSGQLLPAMRAYAVLLDRVGRKRQSARMAARVEGIEARAANEPSARPASRR